MTSPAKPTQRFWVVMTLTLLFGGFLILPFLAFTVGQVIVGPYEGYLGPAGFLAAIFSDFWRGHLGAITLVATPTVIVATWYVVIRVTRRILRPLVNNAGADRARLD